MADKVVLSLLAASSCTGGLVLFAHELSPRFPSLHLPVATTLTYGVPLVPIIRLLFAPLILLVLLPAVGTVLGTYFTFGTQTRRRQLVARTEAEERAVGGYQPFDEEWETRDEEEKKRRQDPKVRVEDYQGIIGFFHPFCNAGGGGERVLWAAIRATQVRYPKSICVVYTGDHDASKSEILKRAFDRFNIEINEPRVHFLYLSTRNLVLPSTWPRFTLLGQSLGSLILLLDAFTLLVPDMFIDTMGYGFSLAMARWLKPSLPTGAYVHYPTISTDMLATLDDAQEPVSKSDSKDTSQMIGRRGVNAGTGKGWKGMLKRRYWQIFAWMYGRAGGGVDVVMTNSSWTQAHVQSLWGPNRQKQQRKDKIEVVFPPCPVEELEKAVPVDEKSERKREDVLVYVAQFRPEKNHELVLHAFSHYLNEHAKSSARAKKARLVLIGSVRDDDDSKRVYNLRLLAKELKIDKQTEFVTNATWNQILEWLRRSSVGINGMWSEHFGIGVVEYQAAGLISVVNDSGGPKLDIVVPIDGKPTGFHASTVADYAEGFHKALEMSPEQKLQTRLGARKSAKRFTEEEFVKLWLAQLSRLIELDIYQRPVRGRTLDTLVSMLLAVAIFDDLKVLFAPAVKSLTQRFF